MKKTLLNKGEVELRQYLNEDYKISFLGVENWGRTIYFVDRKTNIELTTELEWCMENDDNYDEDNYDKCITDAYDHIKDHIEEMFDDMCNEIINWYEERTSDNKIVILNNYLFDEAVSDIIQKYNDGIVMFDTCYEACFDVNC